MAWVVVGALALLVTGPTPTQALITEALSSQLFILPLTHHNFSFQSPGETPERWLKLPTKCNWFLQVLIFIMLMQVVFHYLPYQGSCRIKVSVILLDFKIFKSECHSVKYICFKVHIMVEMYVMKLNFVPTLKQIKKKKNFNHPCQCTNFHESSNKTIIYIFIHGHPSVIFKHTLISQE